MDLTSNMGIPNWTMWKSLGLNHNRASVGHPVALDRQLYFMPDVPHLIKNLKTALVLMRDLLAFQEGITLKITRHLSAAAIETSHFDKMKVGHALNVFNRAKGAARKLPSAQPHYSVASGASCREFGFIIYNCSWH